MYRAKQEYNIRQNKKRNLSDDSQASYKSARNGIPSALASAQARTLGVGPEPRIGFISFRKSACLRDAESLDEIIFCAALTMFVVDLRVGI